jgi:hypothetical protein
MDGGFAMAGGNCAQNQSREALAWAAANFSGADLGDLRRSRRLVELAGAMAENPGMSLPKQLPDWSDLTGAYRFLSNPEVDPKAMLAPHVKLTRDQAERHPVVLCVQDDTSLDFTLRTGIKGLGIIGDGGGRGLLQHSALAVLPDRRVLGLLDVAWHALKEVPEGETRRERQSRWTQRYVWHEAVCTIGRWAEDSQLIHVGDRHCDLFRFMHEARQLGHDFVVRAMHDRYVDEQEVHLWEKLERQQASGQMTVTIGVQRDKGNRVKRVGREAVLTIRMAPVVVGPSSNDPRTQDAKPLALYAVYLLEENPPANVEAVEWMLITSLKVNDLEQARLVISYYTCRWVIEEWHRCLKEGCRIEESQLDDARDIQRLGAVLSVLAIKLLEVRDLPESVADTPEGLRSRVPAIYILIVAGLAKIPPQELTPRQFHLAVAKKGGYLHRKNDPRPGWKVLWRGWNDIVQMVRGAELFRDLDGLAGKCVEG